jgi:ribonuclease HI
MDSQLVVSQLNGVYRVRDPVLLRFFLRVRLLEHSFEFITYEHVPRRDNELVDAYANYVLDWHVYHQ